MIAKQQTNLINQSRLTCVSGYWKIKNKHGNKFDNWFKNTLKINCPYVFFGDKESIALIKNIEVNYLHITLNTILKNL